MIGGTIAALSAPARTLGLRSGGLMTCSDLLTSRLTVAQGRCDDSSP